MQFGLAFTFPFSDTNWVKKILLTALVSIIPFVGMGWSLEISRRVIANEQPTLPDAIDFGGWFMKGIMGAIISIVYVLPIIILGGCLGGSTGLLAALVKDNNTVGMLTSVISICFGCLMALFGIALALIMPAALGNYAATGELGAAFRFGEVIGLVRAVPAVYLLVLVGGIVSGFIAGLGSIACGIGILATAAYANTVNGHLYGQAYLAAKAKIAATPAVVA